MLWKESHHHLKTKSKPIAHSHRQLMSREPKSPVTVQDQMARYRELMRQKSAREPEPQPEEPETTTPVPDLQEQLLTQPKQLPSTSSSPTNEY